MVCNWVFSEKNKFAFTAVFFVVPAAAVVDSIADVQSTDALRVFSPAVVVISITMVLYAYTYTPLTHDNGTRNTPYTHC